jgi:hypothetical protein
MTDLTREQALEVLGLSRGADAERIRQAYRRRARELHPDVGGDPHAFHRLQTAYELVRSTPVDVATAPARPVVRPTTPRDGWAEAGAGFHDLHVDTDTIDWSRPIPDMPFRLDRDLLAILLAADDPVAPLLARSRAPGSRLNRAVRFLDPDLGATLSVTPAQASGTRAHDVELRCDLASRAARRAAGSVALPDGWVRTAGTARITLLRPLRPSRSRRATAVRAADAVAALLSTLAWDLDDWWVLEAQSSSRA